MATTQLTPDEWRRRIRLLAQFKREHGHTRVPQKSNEFPLLARFTKIVLASYRARTKPRPRVRPLTDDEVAQLNSLGFDWQPGAIAHAMRFKARFAQLKAFFDEHGHCRVAANKQLSLWMTYQRTRFRRGLLQDDEERRLRTLGFEFELGDQNWDDGFERLKAYRRARGDCRVPPSWAADRELANWVEYQRERRRQGRLSEDRIRRLHRIGFAWTPNEDTWRRRLEELDAFRAKHGHVVVRTHASALGAWLEWNRKRARNGKLEARKVVALKARGVVFDALSTRCGVWETRLGSLVEFKREFGHCDPPPRWTQAGFRVGRWVSLQRTEKKLGRLSRDRQQQLSRLGFRWSGPPPVPTAREVDALLAFHQKFGHWAVPDESPHQRLHQWLAEARVAIERSRFDPRMTSRLTGLGVPVTGEELRWERMFARAHETVERVGGLRVPKSSTLGRWLEDQRQLAQRGELEGDREDRLAGLGTFS